jgi:hypothetical protein
MDEETPESGSRFAAVTMKDDAVYAVGSVGAGAGEKATVTKLTVGGTRNWRYELPQAQRVGRAVGVLYGGIHVAGEATFDTEFSSSSDLFLMVLPDGVQAPGGPPVLTEYSSVGADHALGILPTLDGTFILRATEAAQGGTDLVLESRMANGAGTPPVVLLEAEAGGESTFLAGRLVNASEIAVAGVRSGTTGTTGMVAYARGDDGLWTTPWKAALLASTGDVKATSACVRGTVTYVAGTTTASLAGGPIHGGGVDAFVAAYTQEGARSWVVVTGAAGDEAAANDRPSVVACSDGVILVTTTTGQVERERLPVGVERALLVMKWGVDGGLQWTRVHEVGWSPRVAAAD